MELTPATFVGMHTRMARPTRHRRTTLLLGERIRALRAKRGYSLADLSERTGIDRCNISKLENGRGPVSPELATVVALARGLGVEPGVLIDPS